MKHPLPHPTSEFHLKSLIAAVASALLCTLSFAALPAQAQAFSILHSFTNGGDGGSPTAPVTIDSAGNLYGTASTGGTGGNGTVFELKRSDNGWTLNTLHAFDYSNGDGKVPLSGVVFGPDGALYGTTSAGGTGCYGGCGTVYNLRPPQTFCHTGVCLWTETIIHNFAGYPHDGLQPEYATPIFDPSGNLYGTTCGGGPVDDGTAFEMSESNGTWTETPIHNFTGGDGECPQVGLLRDRAGNLYGTTLQGTGNQGEVFELTLLASGWTLSKLVVFEEGINGNAPGGPLVADSAGNLYGMTQSGSVFELTYSGGTWAYNQIFDLPGAGGIGPLAMDAEGNLYGTQFVGGIFGSGAVFKLTLGNGTWAYTDMHDFSITNGCAFPYSGVSIDVDGNLYGTASQGGYRAPSCGYWGCGCVWKITP